MTGRHKRNGLALDGKVLADDMENFNVWFNCIQPPP